MEPNMHQINVDTHVHLLLSKKQQTPAWAQINDLLETAASSGLDAICSTEHIESTGFKSLMQSLFIDNVLDGTLADGKLLLDSGLSVYPGAELQLANGSNIGVHTSVDVLLSLNNKAGFYVLEQLRATLENAAVPFALVAHHIFFKGKTYPDHNFLSQHVEAIEIPAKDIGIASEYQALADKYNLATTGGSDAHTYIQVGACQTTLAFEDADSSHRAFIAALSDAKRKKISIEYTRRLVSMSKIYRKQLTTL
jgi:histidinol phosphatase-like PHP family hydrolase